MSPDDDADDDAGGLHPPLPPDDRLWRHPSEVRLHGMGGPTAVTPPSGPGRGMPWAVVLVAGLAGAVLASGIIAATGRLSPDVVERHVVEKVAVTPVVSSPMLETDQGVEAVARRLSPAIARLDVGRDDDLITGSGVLFRDDGMLLTSAHVVDGAQAIRVQLADGRSFDGHLVGLDRLTDVAVVDIEASDLPVAVLGSTEGLEVGAPAVAIGSPLGLEGGPSVTTGVISAVGRSIDPGEGEALHGMLQTDAPIAAGSSGGALVDTAGSVVGIVTAVAAEPAGRFGFATPIELAHRVARQLIETGHATHGWLGVHGADLDPERAAELGVRGGAVVRG
ncbi:MAG TPA: trypsin-like peptidase domain-containing protein, partial [Acidimicrobiales bacterium]|nr:trypsin-like peptidase domain-containing protein [Acidimicrobiales bacterium]